MIISYHLIVLWKLNSTFLIVRLYGRQKPSATSDNTPRHLYQASTPEFYTGIQTEREILGCQYIGSRYIRNETYGYNDTCVRTLRRTREILRWICMPMLKAVKKGHNKLTYYFNRRRCNIWIYVRKWKMLI